MVVRHKKIVRPLKDRVLELSNKGLTREQMSLRLGISMSDVSKYILFLRREGVLNKDVPRS